MGKQLWRDGRLWRSEPGEVKDDFAQDRIEVLTSFCAHLNGRRLTRNKAKKALEAIEREAFE